MGNEDIQKSLADFIHDARTPITVIYTVFELLLLKKCDIPQKDLLDNIKLCKSQLERLRVLLGNYAEVNRLNHDIPVQKQSHNVAALLKSVLDYFGPRFRVEKKELYIEGEPFNFDLDKNLYKQMIHNMIEHMITFTESGSASILCFFKEKDTLVTELKYPNRSFVEEKEKEKIFNVHERILDPHTGAKFNRGFGLSFNRHIATLLNGSFNLQMHPDGKESLLRLQIP